MLCEIQLPSLISGTGLGDTWGVLANLCISIKRNEEKREKNIKVSRGRNTYTSIYIHIYIHTSIFIHIQAVIQSDINSYLDHIFYELFKCLPVGCLECANHC